MEYHGLIVIAGGQCTPTDCGSWQRSTLTYVLDTKLNTLTQSGTMDIGLAQTAVINLGGELFGMYQNNHTPLNQVCCECSVWRHYGRRRKRNETQFVAISSTANAGAHCDTDEFADDTDFDTDRRAHGGTDTTHGCSNCDTDRQPYDRSYVDAD